MSLSSDLISQFVKATKDNTKTSNETTVYGTVIYDGKPYVKLDGTDLLTPISTTTDVNDGERVSVVIKDHTALITGNISSPSARTDDVTKISSKISEFEIIIAHRITTEDLNATTAYIDNLKAITANFTNMEAITAEIETLQAKFIEGWYLSATDAEIINAEIESLRAIFGEFTDLSTEDLEAVNANIDNLKAYVGSFTYLSTDVFEAIQANISSLQVNKLTSTDAELKYANIDFSNIGQAAMEYFYSKSGLIENVIVNDGTITGDLVGVTIKGDLIEGNTVVADKLVIKGDDGIYYKLNYESGALSGDEIASMTYYKVEYDSETYVVTDEMVDIMTGLPVEGAYVSDDLQVYIGMTTDGNEIYYCEMVEYPDWAKESLHGSVIAAKTITATQISVSDLVAFDATIGGFNITDNSIYSEVKDSEGNTTRGIYMDTDGQINFGDANNYIKFYRDDDGSYKLAISAESILYAIGDEYHSITDIGSLTEYVRIGVYEDEPCIELGESDSDFKLIITNTRIMFMEGTDIPAYINNQSLYINKAVIEEELQQGDFVWKIRSNGNMGLMWKGVTS